MLHHGKIATRLGLLVDMLSQDDDAARHPGGRVMFGCEYGVQLGLIEVSEIQLKGGTGLAFGLTHAGDVALSLVQAAIKDGWTPELMKPYLDTIRLE